MTWYIAENGQPKKIHEELLIFKILNNEITPDTLVVNSEIKNWISLEETQIWKENHSAKTSLIKCPECSRDIAANSSECPHCGFPLIPTVTQNQDKSFFQATNENSSVNSPLIKCPECSKSISDNISYCPHCGYPLTTDCKNQHQNQGKAIFQTSNDFIGLLGKYTIKDKNGNIVAKLKANDYFEIQINVDTTFYIRYSGAFTSFKEAFAPANSISRFSIGLSGGGAGFYVRKE